MRVIVVLVLVFAALGGFVAYRQLPAEATSQQPAAVTVERHTVRGREFADRVEALGTLRGNESITVTANVSDIITAIHFREGEQVKAGQLLVTLAQDEEQAQLNGARAELAEQEREVRRLEGLVKTMAAARNELDQRRTALRQAQHRIEELEARIADRRLVAPFAGVLGLRLVSPGALVSAGTPITTLDDIDTLKLDFSVPASLLASLEPGLKLEARTAAYQRQFTGEVTVIDSRVNPVDRSIRARAEFDNREGLLKPGMLMTVELLRNPRQALLVPEAALLSREQQHSVWLIDADDRLHRKTVEIGSRQPGWVEIVSGLEAGDTIGADNYPRLREGVKVRAQDTASDKAS